MGYSNSDSAGSLDDMKNTSNYVFSLGSELCSWLSKKQKIVAQSSAKVEYVAAAKATLKVIWVRRILEDLGEKQRMAQHCSMTINQKLLSLKIQLFMSAQST